VSPNESAALEESISRIHRFFSDQPGFIEAELTRASGDSYELTEEWSSLKAYQEAVQLPGFQELAKTVPGSSNWRSETLLN
jgi:quinol monooxygenase YgiN